MENIVNFNDIELNNLVFSPIKESRGGSYLSQIENLRYINLPKCLSKEGFSISNKNCYIDIELENNELFDFLNNIDQYFKSIILNNSDDWLSYSFTEEQINDFYESMISYRKKFNRQPFFRLKIPLYKGNIAIRIIDEDNNEIISERLPSDEMILSGILEIKGIKFLKQEVLCDIELATIVIHNPKKKQNNITGLIKEKKRKTTNKTQGDNKSKIKENDEKTNRSVDNIEKIEENSNDLRADNKKRVTDDKGVSVEERVDNGQQIENGDELVNEERVEKGEGRDNEEQMENIEGRDNDKRSDKNDDVSISYYKDDLNKELNQNDDIDIKSIDNIIKEKRKIIDELESKKKYIEDKISQKENQEIVSDSYSEIDRQEERRDKIIRRELIDRLRIERNRANTLFAEAQKVMEIYEEKRENALHQVAIVKELELELNNLE